MKVFFSVIFVCCTLVALAQPENPQIEEINGKKYYVHIVQGGNTLWGLSQLYKTTAEKIIEVNPPVANGLQVGQKLIFPVNGTDSTPIQVDAKAPETHKVEKGDNLYNISKRYGVSMEDLVKLNPGSETSIAIGQELKLPATAKANQSTGVSTVQTQVSFSDSIVDYVVLSHETLYIISKRFMVPVEDIKKLNNLKNDKIRKNDIIKIPVKKEKITKV